MMPKLYLAGAIGVIILALSGYAWFEHTRYVSTKAEYDTFVAKAQVLAAQRLAENERKEKEYANKLHAAESARAAALNKLRQGQERAARARMSITPGSPLADQKVCFGRSDFDGSLQRFLKSTEGLITEGDTALIDKNTLLEAWPQ